MARSTLYRLNSDKKTSKVPTEVAKEIKKAASKPKSKGTAPSTERKHGPSCTENKKIQVDQKVLEKVIEAFKKRKKTGTPDLLEDSTGVPVYLQITLSRLNPEVHVKPLQM